MVVLKELIFNSFLFGMVVVVLKELILTDFNLERCACLDSTNCSTVSNLEGYGTEYVRDMVVLKEHDF